MKRILLFVVIICLALLFCAGAQETNKPAEPTLKPVTQLTVKMIDDIGKQVIELNNCVVQVIGELHICEDSFNYSNTFMDGDMYDITIWIKSKNK